MSRKLTTAERAKLLQQKSDILAKGQNMVDGDKALVERLTKLIEADDALIEAEKANKGTSAAPAGAESHAMSPDEKSKSNQTEQTGAAGSAESKALEDKLAELEDKIKSKLAQLESLEAGSGDDYDDEDKSVEPAKGEEDYYIVRLSKGPKFNAETGERITANSFRQIYSRNEFQMLMDSKSSLGYTVKVIYDPTSKK